MSRAYNINITEMIEQLEEHKRKHNLENLDELRQAIDFHSREGKKIISHFNKMQEYYDEWQSRLIEIDNAIENQAKEHGLSREEILAPIETDVLDILDDL